MSELNNEDVVSTGMADPSFAFGLGSTFQLFELMDAVRKAVSSPKLASQYWFSEGGVRCKVLLSQGGGWHAGIVRFRLEFIPDNPPSQPQEPSSPLADLRSNLDI